MFGNQGWLYMRAMTWWDHDTGSIWSQPLGTALVGPLRGTTLSPLSAALVPWGTWRREHPDALVLAEEGTLRGPLARERPRDDFVVGVALGEHAAAFRYRDAARLRVINHRVGPHPVLLYADPLTRRVQTLIRQLPDRTLTFALRDGRLTDRETGSVWDPLRGIATEGPLRGQVLRVIPHTPAFEWAWLDFYPPRGDLRAPLDDPVRKASRPRPVPSTPEAATARGW